MGCSCSVAPAPIHHTEQPGLFEKPNENEGTLPCSNPKCRCRRVIESRAVTKTKFQGSIFCARHHIDRFRQLYTDPTLDHFLKFSIVNMGPDYLDEDVNPRGELDMQVYNEYLYEANKPNLMSAYVALCKFRQFSTVSRLQRASQIYEKFVRIGASHLAVPLEPQEVQYIHDQLKGCVTDSDVSLDMFLPLESKIIEELEDEFEGFLGSNVYRKFLKSFPLPDAVANQLALKERDSALDEKEYYDRRKIRFSHPIADNGVMDDNSDDRPNYSPKDLDLLSTFNFNLSLEKIALI